MFQEKNYKYIIKSIFQLLFLIPLLIGNFVEFIMYFVVTGSFTFLDVHFPKASAIEFFIALIFSLLLSLISILLIRWNKINNTMEYIICILLIVPNILKLLFFLPSISFHKEYLFYIAKQFIPFITNGGVIFFGILQLGEIRYNKYK